ncbi:MAG: TRAM domain-containing protein, partial [Armatimonadetes bacterium]
KIFDTNVIIDGRIGEVVRTGFVDGKIYIPQFVINELQKVADSADPNKRQRGRRGLDMLKILRADHEVEIGTLDHLAPDNGSVDERLVALARALGAKLVTNDFNLNKVAQVHGVQVLNVNDLALSLRPIFLPGDTLEVIVERPGSQPGQGVGFLEDGTMVVIEQAAELVGSKVEARVTQIHQSAAGRMIFAQVEGVLPRNDD